MSDSLIIPDDLSACQKLISQLMQTIARLTTENADQQLLINELLQQAVRKRSERYLENPSQLKLDFGNTPEIADAADGLADAVEQADLIIGEHRRRKRDRKPRNEQLPPHLPRYEAKLDVPESVKTCEQHGARKLIGYDRQETLEFERPKLRVRVTLIPKFVCEQEPACGVVEAPRPQGLVEGNRYDTSIAAEIVTAKCGYHLPIYRQQDWFASSGWTPGRSTLLNILTVAAELIRPLIASFRTDAIQSGLLGTDDTRVTLLLPPEISEPIAGDAKSKRIHEVFTEARTEGRPSVSGRMWAYRSLILPLNVFDFTVSRHRDGPDAFLVERGFTGKLMADCYSGYLGIELRSDSRIVHAACVAHARRKVFDAREYHPLLSSQFLAMFQELYDVEDRARTMSAENRQALREAEARPVWERMRMLLDSDIVARLLPKEKFTEALGYIRNQWDALQVYLTDGRLPIDNNEVEQLMKQVAIGRNYAEFRVMRSCERISLLLPT